MAEFHSDVLSYQNPRTPWASMVIHLVSEHCFANETIVDEKGNIGFALTGCRQRVYTQELAAEIEILSVTMVGMVFTSNFSLENHLRFKINHRFTATLRLWWNFTVNQCVLIDERNGEYRFDAKIDDPVGIDEITLPGHIGRERLDRRSRRCRRQKCN